MPKKKELKKSDLKPGMKVQNIVSDCVGEVRDNPERPGTLMRSHSDFVRIRTKGNGEIWKYPCWAIVNLKIVRG